MGSHHGIIIPAFLVLLSIVFTCGLHPVVLVPGDGGSQMEAKLNKTDAVHYVCNKKTTEYFNIWLNLELLVPVVIDCWIDNVRLVYNASTRTTSNSPGVDIRHGPWIYCGCKIMGIRYKFMDTVPGWGNTTVVEFLDPSQASPGHYFQAIVEQSLLPLGYERNVNIRGAPYDFRKAPNEMQEWLKNFKVLIEDTYESNGNSSVILICHSMGSPISLYFLHRMTQSWKDKHIRSLMTLGGVWGGSVKALKVFAAGDDLGSYVLPSRTLRGEQRTSPSTAWLLPHKSFWDKDEILVTIPGKGNYTVNDYESFFKEMDYIVGYEMRKDTENLLGDLQAPGVEVHCLHGSGVSTVENMIYKDIKYFPDKPNLNYGNGDGTVNIRSLRGCLRWNTTLYQGGFKTRYSKKSQNVKYRKKWKMKMASLKPDESKHPQIFHAEYPGVDHMNILRDSRVITYIKEAVEKMNSEFNEVLF